MLHIHYSNRLESLFDELLEIQSKAITSIESSSLANILEPDRILVQSQGMARWLSIQISQKRGIAANIQYPYPASYLWSVLTQQIHGLPERSSFDKNLLQWRILKLLPVLLEQSEFEPLRHYLQDDINEDAQGMKAYQLAGKVADIFDQYLVYRPDWIQQWEQNIPDEVQSAWQMALTSTGEIESSLFVKTNHNHNGISHSDWQAKLWCELVKSIVLTDTDDNHTKEWHRARLVQEFLVLAKQGKLNTELFPDTLHVFGVSVLPPVYLQLFQVMAQTTDVHLYVMNPSLGYWGDLVTPNQLARLRKHWDQQGKADISHAYDSGNDLLVSLGRQGQEYQVLLQELIHDQQAIEHDRFDEALAGQPSDSSLLSLIQSDILQLENRYLQGGKTALMPDQVNIRVHDCHSPMREVEVLHDQLLHCFETHTDLKPHDIVVMVPDVDRYSPYIQAVFGTKRGGHYIPFSVADRHGRQEHPILEAFFQLLSLAGSDFAMPDVLSLLNVKAVQTRFEFEDIPKLTQWITGANIRWGLNSEQRQAKGVKTAANTWRFGIQRMLMGYLYGDLDETLHFGDDPVSPLVSVEGNLANDVGKLAQFIEGLAAIDDLGSKKTITQWKDSVFQLLEQFFMAEGGDEALLQIIRDVMTSLYENTQQADFDEPIHFSIIQDYLERHVGEISQGQHFLSGQVSFCTLMPMRAIPFKVIALMGLNDSDYPRRQPRLGFDLMAKDHRKGDRSRREDDRYLFLEALLSARSHLHISFIGRSIRDNAEKQPSVLVSELLDYANASFCIDQDGSSSDNSELESHIKICHPLQPFNGMYFDDSGNRLNSDDKIHSFNTQWLSVTHKLHDKQATAHTKKSKPETSDLFDALEDERDESQSFIPFFASQPPSSKVLELSEQATEAHINFDELKQFFAHPAKAILRKKLGIELYSQIYQHEKTETYQLDGLQTYHYVEDAVGKILADQLQDNHLSPANVESSIDHFLDSLVSEGALPYSAFGTLSQKSLHANIKAFVAPILDANYQPLDDIELKLDLTPNLVNLSDHVSVKHNNAQVQLTGWIHNHFAEQLDDALDVHDKEATAHRIVQWRYSKVSGKNILACWLDHLAFCAQTAQGEERADKKGQGGRSHYYARDQKVIFKALSASSAIHYLNELVGIYCLAQAYWLPIFPKSGWAYCSTVASHAVAANSETDEDQAEKQKVESKALKAAIENLEGGRAISGEIDEWYQYLYRDQSVDVDSLFCSLHTRLFQPILQHMEQEDINERAVS